MVGSVTEKVITGVLPGVVGAALMMLYWNFAAAAASLGRETVRNDDILVVGEPPCRVAQRAGAVVDLDATRVRYGLVRFGRIGLRVPK